MNFDTWVQGLKSVLIARGHFISQFYADIGLCPMDVYGMYRSGISEEAAATQLQETGWFKRHNDDLSSGDRPAIPPKDKPKQ